MTSAVQQQLSSSRARIACAHNGLPSVQVVDIPQQSLLLSQYVHSPAEIDPLLLPRVPSLSGDDFLAFWPELAHASRIVKSPSRIHPQSAVVPATLSDLSLLEQFAFPIQPLRNFTDVHSMPRSQPWMQPQALSSSSMSIINTKLPEHHPLTIQPRPVLSQVHPLLTSMPSPEELPFYFANNSSTPASAHSSGTIQQTLLVPQPPVTPTPETSPTTIPFTSSTVAHEITNKPGIRATSTDSDSASDASFSLTRKRTSRKRGGSSSSGGGSGKGLSPRDIEVRKRPRASMSKECKARLKAVLATTLMPSLAVQQQLADEFGIDKKRIRVWFQK
ncbi:hypothetical protein BC830DRAFT_1172687 [Chytriomyces sp. MP71]|nr:hypothetical protein BC830DRAFT_1172687 [Chytriomyces sp. MP71]